MFSFDLPASQLNRQRVENSPLFIPQIERLLANTLSRSIGNNTTNNIPISDTMPSETTTSTTTTTISNNDNSDNDNNDNDNSDNDNSDNDNNYLEVD